MRAAVTREPGTLPAITTLPDPEPGPGEVLIQVDAVGLCGTDLKLLDGMIPTVTYPLVQGHEVMGRVAGGEGPTGARVAVYIPQACGDCRWCARGLTNICPRATRMGFERPGGLAEYVVARAENVVAVPAAVTDEMAAVTLDAVLSPYRALKVRGEVGPGDRVVIVGGGGLGLHGVQIAIALGARVAVVDLDPGKLETASRLGAEVGVLAADEGTLGEWAPDGADVVMESSGAPAGFRLATEVVRPGGTVVTCGYKPGSDASSDSMRLAMDELTIRGSKGGTRADADGALALIAEGKVAPLIARTGGLDDVPAFVQDLRAGEQVGRLVVRPR
ncbi:alcohol dehydrogenase catalytic domain-containing protein [Pseudonocardia lutea]|uniref:alcohol dehydrogenase n=1 Tax=Pseudonocardia lutea TaxID=2172015 RepID=A0ABW1I3D6_9PSEU